MSLLHMAGITRHFGRHAVLQGIDLDVVAGERIALHGANGAGKTTLLRIAAGTIGPTSGRVERAVNGYAYLAQDAPVYRELSVLDHLRFVTKIHRTPWNSSVAIDQLQDAGLARLADQPAGNLSRGQRQRLGITLATIGSPELLLLDEPWTGLDAQGAQWLSDILANTDAAVLAAVHENSPFLADRTLSIHEGRLQ